jgi:hypothetical protein
MLSRCHLQVYVRVNYGQSVLNMLALSVNFSVFTPTLLLNSFNALGKHGSLLWVEPVIISIIIANRHCWRCQWAVSLLLWQPSPIVELNRQEHHGLFESTAVMSVTFQHMMMLSYAVSLSTYSASHFFESEPLESDDSVSENNETSKYLYQRHNLIGD